MKDTIKRLGLETGGGKSEKKMSINVAPADAEWIRAALDRHESELTLYAQRLTGNREQARDVVQETFLRLCTQAPAEIQTHLAEWLFSVCRNLSMDARRKERHMVALAEINLQTRKSAEAAPTPVEQSERNEDSARIFELLNTLPDNQQEVIRLKFQHGLSYREISTVTKLSVSNVGFLIHTGLKTIRAGVANEARA